MKYWDVIPPKKTKKKELTDFEKLIRDINSGKYNIPKVQRWVSVDSQCLHKNCPNCRMGICSGIHMISCPCRECTPQFLMGSDISLVAAFRNEV